jgi:hypothetical protein
MDVHQVIGVAFIVLALIVLMVGLFGQQRPEPKEGKIIRVEFSGGFTDEDDPWVGRC